MATWSSRSWSGCTDAGEDLPVKKEEAHTTDAAGGGGINPLTTDSDGKRTQLLGIHRREQKLQELPKLEPRLVLHQASSALSLAGTAGRENAESSNMKREAHATLLRSLASSLSYCWVHHWGRTQYNFGNRTLMCCASAPKREKNSS